MKKKSLQLLTTLLEELKFQKFAFSAPLEQCFDRSEVKGP